MGEVCLMVGLAWINSFDLRKLSIKDKRNLSLQNMEARVQYKVPQCAVKCCSVQTLFNELNSTLYSVQYADTFYWTELYTVPCTLLLYTVHCILYTVHCTVQCTLFTELKCTLAYRQHSTESPLMGSRIASNYPKLPEGMIPLLQIALLYNTLHCTALYCTALHCSTLHCTLLFYSILQYTGQNFLLIF